MVAVAVPFSAHWNGTTFDGGSLELDNTAFDTNYRILWGDGLSDTVFSGDSKSADSPFHFYASDGDYSVKVKDLSGLMPMVKLEADVHSADTAGLSIKDGNMNTLVLGGSGDDTIRVGSGDNLIDGAGGNNTITAGNGNNVVFAATGDNMIHLGNGNNDVFMNSGNNTVMVGTGTDTFHFAPQQVVVTAAAVGGGAVVVSPPIVDSIKGFQSGVDTIDLTAYGPMTDIGSNRFDHNGMPEVRVTYNAMNGNSLIQVDAHGTGAPTLEIRVMHAQVAESDLHLSSMASFLV